MESDNHCRTIIHIDLDCFYAQVEMLKNPALRTVPVGVQQKFIVVTSNYLAREYGVNKCIQVSEALKLCPNLTLVKGEDLHDYRLMSAKVHAVISKFSTCVEKLGLDENFIDVSELVKNRLKPNLKTNAIGHVYGSSVEECDCGCFERLNIGSVIASEMRENIKTELGLTCCAGIGHNKLLAKLVGAVNKPNQQTIIYPSNAAQLLCSLPDVKSIPGIGQHAYDTFKTINIRTIEELRVCSMDTLQKTFSADKAKQFLEFSYGKDESPVKPTGRPLSIGLEDSCSYRSLSVEKEVRDKFLQLLHRLMILVTEDGRIPRTLKVTLRKFDKQRKTSHREQRQCNISPSYFAIGNVVKLSHTGEEKLIGTIMCLFHKLVDITKPYHVTLLGLAFTKFLERQNGKNSIASFLMNNLSVQSVTSLQNNSLQNKETTSLPMEYSPVSQKSLDLNTDGSESEIEPSPKKAKYGSLMAKRRCLDDSLECPSPSKLRVAELRLNSREMDRSPVDDSQCPGNVDPDVFKELPEDVQNELLQQWKMEKKSTFPPLKKPKTNTLFAYLIKNK